MEIFPFNYLGFFLVEKFRTNVDKWRRVSLSKGDITLTHAVLNTLLYYFFSLHESSCQSDQLLGEIFSDFVWDGSTLKSASHLVAWKWTSLPTNYGGLGTGSLHQRNQSLFMMWTNNMKDKELFSFVEFVVGMGEELSCGK